MEDVTQYSFFVDEEEDEVIINVENLKKSGKVCVARQKSQHDNDFHCAADDRDLSSAEHTEQRSDGVSAENFAREELLTVVAAKMPSLLGVNSFEPATYCEAKVEEDSSGNADDNIVKLAGGDSEINLLSDRVADCMVEQSCQTSFLFVSSEPIGNPSVASKLSTLKPKVCESRQEGRLMSKAIGLPKGTVSSAAQKNARMTFVPVRSRCTAENIRIEKSPFKCPKTPTLVTKGKSPSSLSKQTKSLSPWKVESPVAKYIHENPVPHLVHAVRPQKPAPSKAFSGVPKQALAEKMPSPSRPIIAKRYQSSNKGKLLTATPIKHNPSQPFVMKHAAPAHCNASNADVEASVVHVLPARRLR